MTVWLDVTTLMSWCRPALGIVRVETEIARLFLQEQTFQIRFCRFDAPLKSYFEVSSEQLRSAITTLDQCSHHKAPLPGHDEHPVSLVKELPCVLHKGWVQPFAAGDVYISLGLDWDQKDLTFLYELKQALDFNVILFCYDIIPILFPKYCVKHVAETFPAYIADVAWCADKIFCISNCTQNDLKNYLKKVGAPVPALDVAYLGSTLPKADADPSPAVKKICRDRFILFVSTIEARKNHVVLYRAYRRLLEQGVTRLPKLVFVGMQGWGVADFLEKMRRDKLTAPYIDILDHVSDADLVTLYQHCDFTVYPSLYEGWGLPVAESLAYGKFCLASSAASIPEIAGDLIDYVDPEDVEAWSGQLLWFVEHREDLEKREKKIKKEFELRSWKDTVTTVLKESLEGRS